MVSRRAFWLVCFLSYLLLTVSGQSNNTGDALIFVNTDL